MLYLAVATVLKLPFCSGHFQLGTMSIAIVPYLRCPNEQETGTASWFHFAVPLSCNIKLIGDSGMIMRRKHAGSKISTA